jgi:hypothetical protein
VSDIYDLAAHLDQFDGTQVEKHWARLKNLTKQYGAIQILRDTF